MLQYFKMNPNRGRSSRVASLHRTLFLLVPPFTVAAVMTGVWLLLFQLGLYLPHDVKEMLGTAILLQAAIFAIAAAMVLTGTWERVRMISRHILRKEQHEFMAIRDEKMPIAMHLVLAASGLSVLILLSVAHYPSRWSGGIIIFSSWFIMVLYFMVVAAMQNITTSPWVRNRIPEDWLDLKVDEFFATGFLEHGRSAHPKQEAKGAGADASRAKDR